ncbi:MAG: tocopherol cyclase family protein [Ignavibacteriales bacterium]|nr:tocopherol cyclase family protein [Ignavibacteriales bacterium]
MSYYRNLFHPEHYHGASKKPPFFEGWYFKIVDAAGRQKFAVIPGIFLHDNHGDRHSFIQILNGVTGKSTYHQFPFESFSYDSGCFEIRIGTNRFTRTSISLGIDGNQQSMKGTLEFAGIKPWPITLRSPGVMGWYAWIPVMECNHGVLSMDHEISGTLCIDDTAIDFTGGRGYIEKDWGKSFPLAHIWMQTNHFGTPGTSLSASVAIIPWTGYSFPGFIVGFLHQGTLHRFATYTGTKITSLDVTDTDIYWSMESKKERLTIHAARTNGGLLHAPTTAEMSQRLMESLTSSVDATLTDRDGQSLFSGRGMHAGLEVGGNVDNLISLWKSSKR